ncbi:hypothetical protein ACN6MT_04355 [Neobacillus niacini]
MFSLQLTGVVSTNTDLIVTATDKANNVSEFTVSVNK